MNIDPKLQRLQTLIEQKQLHNRMVTPNDTSANPARTEEFNALLNRQSESVSSNTLTTSTISKPSNTTALARSKGGEDGFGDILSLSRQTIRANVPIEATNSKENDLGRYLDVYA